MQTPHHRIGRVLFRALPACLAALIPPELASWAEWSVNAYTGDDWTETKAGWIADAPPGRRVGQRGRGPFMAFLGGGPYGPDLTYLRHVRSSRQGLRVVAEAYAAWERTQPRIPAPPRVRGRR